MSDRSGVLAANVEFYESLEAGDLDRLERLWVDGDGAVCVHPGLAAIRGRRAVLRSWAAVLAATPYLQFVLTDIDVEIEGDVAIVSCTENLLSAADGMPDTVFAGGHAVATNVFRHDGARWRLWAHHSSPVGGDS